MRRRWPGLPDSRIELLRASATRRDAAPTAPSGRPGRLPAGLVEAFLLAERAVVELAVRLHTHGQPFIPFLGVHGVYAGGPDDQVIDLSVAVGNRAGVQGAEAVAFEFFKLDFGATLRGGGMPPRRDGR